MRPAFLSAILFLSGSSGLLFQTLWLRRSGLVFGNAVWSAALILSSFMAGLALGNALAAAGRRPRWRPLRLYAVLELAVALTGVALVVGLPFAGEGLRPLFQSLEGAPGVLNALRFGLTFVLLVIPTTAMGLTLPVLLSDPVLESMAFHRATALLYGWNTLGAVAGAIGGEAWLVARFGITGTAVFAAALNLAAAGGAWLLATLAPIERAERARGRVENQTVPRVSLPWRWLAISFGTGAVFLTLEVVWFRFIRLYVASSPVAFATLLAMVLAGIGCGSLVSSLLAPRWVRPATLIVPLLLTTAGLVLVTYAGFPVPPPHGATATSYVEDWPTTARLAFALMFPVAFASGMLFPAVVNEVQAREPDRARAAGQATLANTIGAAIGPLLAGFVLLPQLGFEASLHLAAAAYVLLALLASDRSAWSPRTVRGAVTVLAAAGTLAAFVTWPAHRDAVHFANARRPYEVDGSFLRRKIEGTADTFQLLERDLLGEPYAYRLLTNGFSMSGTNPQSQRYMRMFAYLPLALDPAAQQALLICYGVGVTADALTQDPQLKRIDIVDVAHEVFDLSSEYRPPAHRNPLLDPRVKTHVQDGRFYLQATRLRYDVITGEPPPLKMAGTVNLYTEEFFSAMAARLNDGGIASFWLPIYQLKVDEVKAILAAFHHAFPRASVWGGADHEWIMLGIKGDTRPLHEDAFARLWQIPATRADLVRIGVESPADLGAWFVMDADEIDRITHGVAPLTDEFPKRLSDAPPDAAAIQTFAAPYMDGTTAYQRFRASELGRLWPAKWRDAAEMPFGVRETRYQATTIGSNWLAELDLYLRFTRLRTPVLDVLHTDEWRIALAETRARDAGAATGAVVPELVAAALARRDYAGAIRWLEQTRDQPANPNDPLLLTYLYCLDGKVRAAEAFARGHAGQFPADTLTTWLWQKLRTEYGFQPPR